MTAPRPATSQLRRRRSREGGPDHWEFTKYHRRRRLVLRFPLCGAAPSSPFFCSGLRRVFPAQDAPANKESDFLSRVRRLTVEGRRAGEGYWSPDGTRLVFQSEREPGNPFYQIYTLDLSTGDATRVSPGYGKTTCSFFRPGSDQILFASTHHDPRSKQLQQEELDFRASGRQRRYSWDYDPEFEIYSYSPSRGPRARRRPTLA